MDGFKLEFAHYECSIVKFVGIIWVHTISISFASRSRMITFHVEKCEPPTYQYNNSQTALVILTLTPKETSFYLSFNRPIF